MRTMKVQASALQSVLTISIVIIVMIVALLVFSMNLGVLIQKDQRIDKLNRNAVSGMNILLSGTELRLNENSIIDLYDNDSDSVYLHKIAWGIYEVYMAYAFSNADTIKKEAIAGSLLLPEEKLALYLADHQRPLSISGKTLIVGDVRVPEAGIRKAYIEGQAFIGTKTVNGNTKDSKEELPRFDNTILANLDSLLTNPTAQIDESDNSTSYPADSIDNPFSNPVYYIYSKDSLYLDNIYLKGNIIVVSNSAVQVDSSAILKDIQIYAPSVAINQGFKGSVQIFSRDSIRVKKNVVLEYPSVLGLITAKQDKHHYDNNPSINIEQSSQINGIVFSSTADKEIPFPIIQIDKDVKVYGQLFASGMLQLQGEVGGSTITNGFILKTPSTLYDNFILNGIMDFSKLSEFYLGSRLFNKNKIAGILKWL